MIAKPPSKPPRAPRALPRVPPPPIPRKEPSFNDSPTEARTGRTNQIVGDWRQILQCFDDLEPEGKDALAQIAHALLRAQVARNNRRP